MQEEKIFSFDIEKTKEEIYIPPKQSANSLFRFFEKQDYLLNALEKKAMIPRYYSENVEYLGIKHYQLAYPMVCFCDITLHRLEEHMNLYGKYGIAFSKTWGIDKGIQPLQYINKNSILCKDFSSAFKSAMQEEEETIAINFLLTQMLYMKPIEGRMPRNGKEIEKNFTDECEWRFIPDVSSIKLPPVILEEDMPSVPILNDTMEIHESCWLSFEFSDIKYIILETEEDFSNICKHIEQAVKNENEKHKLISKIIIWNDSKEDF